MGLFSHDNNDNDQALADSTQRLNVNDGNEQNERGWSTGAKVAAGLGAAAAATAAVGGGIYAYKKHEENKEHGE